MDELLNPLSGPAFARLMSPDCPYRGLADGLLDPFCDAINHPETGCGRLLQECRKWQKLLGNGTTRDDLNDLMNSLLREAEESVAMVAKTDHCPSGPGKKVLTTGEVAKILKVAPRTVSKWFDAGKLKGYRLEGSNDRRIPIEALEAFCLEHNMPFKEGE
jgi:excisionase family DNA binding protein